MDTNREPPAKTPVPPPITDLEIIRGRPGRPVAVLVHGLGMNRRFWNEPEKCPALGGTSDLSVFFSEKPAASAAGRISAGVYIPGRVRGLAKALQEAGFGVASWSQRRPAGPIQAAIDELGSVLRTIRSRLPSEPVVLIGHSRGGLVARHCAATASDPGIAGLVTLGTPHLGSRLAEIAKLLTPAASLLNRLLPEDLRGQTVEALKRTAGFFTSPAIDELKPGTDFIGRLPAPPAHLPRLLLAGTDPHLFDLYFRAGTDSPWKTLRFPEFLLSPWPGEMIPEELRESLGDGLVSVESALGMEGEKLEVPANHVAMAFEPRVHERIIAFLESTTIPQEVRDRRRRKAEGRRPK